MTVEKNMTAQDEELINLFLNNEDLISYYLNKKNKYLSEKDKKDILLKLQDQQYTSFEDFEVVLNNFVATQTNNSDIIHYTDPNRKINTYNRTSITQLDKDLEKAHAAFLSLTQNQNTGTALQKNSIRLEYSSNKPANAYYNASHYSNMLQMLKENKDITTIGMDIETFNEDIWQIATSDINQEGHNLFLSVSDDTIEQLSNLFNKEYSSYEPIEKVMFDTLVKLGSDETKIGEQTINGDISFSLDAYTELDSRDKKMAAKGFERFKKIQDALRVVKDYKTENGTIISFSIGDKTFLDEIIYQHKYDVITGHNILAFDIPKIMRRMRSIPGAAEYLAENGLSINELFTENKVFDAYDAIKSLPSDYRVAYATELYSGKKIDADSSKFTLANFEELFGFKDKNSTSQASHNAKYDAWASARLLAEEEYTAPLSKYIALVNDNKKIKNSTIDLSTIDNMVLKHGVDTNNDGNILFLQANGSTYEYNTGTVVDKNGKLLGDKLINQGLVNLRADSKQHITGIRELPFDSLDEQQQQQIKKIFPDFKGEKIYTVGLAEGNKESFVIADQPSLKKFLEKNISGFSLKGQEDTLEDAAIPRRHNGFFSRNMGNSSKNRVAKLKKFLQDNHIFSTDSIEDLSQKIASYSAGSAINPTDVFLQQIGQLIYDNNFSNFHEDTTILQTLDHLQYLASNPEALDIYNNYEQYKTQIENIIDQVLDEQHIPENQKYAYKQQLLNYAKTQFVDEYQKIQNVNYLERGTPVYKVDVSQNLRTLLNHPVGDFYIDPESPYGGMSVVNKMVNYYSTKRNLSPEEKFEFARRFILGSGDPLFSPFISIFNQTIEERNNYLENASSYINLYQDYITAMANNTSIDKFVDSIKDKYTDTPFGKEIKDLLDKNSSKRKKQKSILKIIQSGFYTNLIYTLDSQGNFVSNAKGLGDAITLNAKLKFSDKLTPRQIPDIFMGLNPIAVQQTSSALLGDISQLKQNITKEIQNISISPQDGFEKIFSQLAVSPEKIGSKIDAVYPVSSQNNRYMKELYEKSYNALHDYYKKFFGFFDELTYDKKTGKLVGTIHDFDEFGAKPREYKIAPIQLLFEDGTIFTDYKSQKFNVNYKVQKSYRTNNFEIDSSLKSILHTPPLKMLIADKAIDTTKPEILNSHLQNIGDNFSGVIVLNGLNRHSAKKNLSIDFSGFLENIDTIIGDKRFHEYLKKYDEDLHTNYSASFEELFKGEYIAAAYDPEEQKRILKRYVEHMTTKQRELLVNLSRPLLGYYGLPFRDDIIALPKEKDIENLTLFVGNISSASDAGNKQSRGIQHQADNVKNINLESAEDIQNFYDQLNDIDLTEGKFLTENTEGFQKENYTNSIKLKMAKGNTKAILKNFNNALEKIEQGEIPEELKGYSKEELVTILNRLKKLSAIAEGGSIVDVSAASIFQASSPDDLQQIKFKDSIDILVPERSVVLNNYIKNIKTTDNVTAENKSNTETIKEAQDKQAESKIKIIQANEENSQVIRKMFLDGKISGESFSYGEGVYVEKGDVIAKKHSSFTASDNQEIYAKYEGIYKFGFFGGDNSLITENQINNIIKEATDKGFPIHTMEDLLGYIKQYHKGYSYLAYIDDIRQKDSIKLLINESEKTEAGVVFGRIGSLYKKNIQILNSLGLGKVSDSLSTDLFKQLITHPEEYNPYFAHVISEYMAENKISLTVPTENGEVQIHSVELDKNAYKLWFQSKKEELRKLKEAAPKFLQERTAYGNMMKYSLQGALMFGNTDELHHKSYASLMQSAINGAVETIKQAEKVSTEEARKIFLERIEKEKLPASDFLKALKLSKNGKNFIVRDSYTLNINPSLEALQSVAPRNDNLYTAIFAGTVEDKSFITGKLSDTVILLENGQILSTALGTTVYPINVSSMHDSVRQRSMDSGNNMDKTSESLQKAAIFNHQTYQALQEQELNTDEMEKAILASGLSKREKEIRLKVLKSSNGLVNKNFLEQIINRSFFVEPGKETKIEEVGQYLASGKINDFLPQDTLERFKKLKRSLSRSTFLKLAQTITYNESQKLNKYLLSDSSNLPLRSKAYKEIKIGDIKFSDNQTDLDSTDSESRALLIDFKDKDIGLDDAFFKERRLSSKSFLGAELFIKTEQNNLVVHDPVRDSLKTVYRAKRDLESVYKNEPDDTKSLNLKKEKFATALSEFYTAQYESVLGMTSPFSKNAKSYYQYKISKKIGIFGNDVLYGDLENGQSYSNTLFFEGEKLGEYTKRTGLKPNIAIISPESAIEMGIIPKSPSKEVLSHLETHGFTGYFARSPHTQERSIQAVQIYVNPYAQNNKILLSHFAAKNAGGDTDGDTAILIANQVYAKDKNETYLNINELDKHNLEKLIAQKADNDVINYHGHDFFVKDIKHDVFDTNNSQSFVSLQAETKNANINSAIYYATIDQNANFTKQIGEGKLDVKGEKFPRLPYLIVGLGEKDREELSAIHRIIRNSYIKTAEEDPSKYYSTYYLNLKSEKDKERAARLFSRISSELESREIAVGRAGKSDAGIAEYYIASFKDIFLRERDRHPKGTPEHEMYQEIFPFLDNLPENFISAKNNKGGGSQKSLAELFGNLFNPPNDNRQKAMDELQNALKEVNFKIVGIHQPDYNLNSSLRSFFKAYSNISLDTLHDAYEKRKMFDSSSYRIFYDIRGISKTDIKDAYIDTILGLVGIGPKLSQADSAYGPSIDFKKPDVEDSIKRAKEEARKAEEKRVIDKMKRKIETKNLVAGLAAGLILGGFTVPNPSEVTHPDQKIQKQLPPNMESTEDNTNFSDYHYYPTIPQKSNGYIISIKGQKNNPQNVDAILSQAFAHTFNSQDLNIQTRIEHKNSMPSREDIEDYMNNNLSN